jgi:hypothetical protein
MDTGFVQSITFSASDFRQDSAGTYFFIEFAVPVRITALIRSTSTLSSILKAKVCRRVNRQRIFPILLPLTPCDDNSGATAE